MHSYTHLPTTLEHPAAPITTDNWKEHATGNTGDEVLRDGGTVRVPMMLRDAKAIEAWKDGSKRQLSVGYTWRSRAMESKSEKKKRLSQAVANLMEAMQEEGQSSRQKAQGLLKVLSSDTSSPSRNDWTD
jgi:hypothetical protein